ncbi:DUF2155 domain-containing protein [Oceaniglobus trochenteri]|uniref:DUF2155 domain-containing protein n=1 Tax=Oceaniglobus trochenteri TaxID=2763260 RepID=UPI001CFF893D|nr:DUF2155 domain-containing protein [Oceaniglobus trochenteri]
MDAGITGHVRADAQSVRAIHLMLKPLALCAALLGAAAPLHGQAIDVESSSARVQSAPGAILRGLDKVSGIVSEIDISVGQTVALGRLQITLGDCRYPANNPAGDAYAWLVIRDAGVDQPHFQGWMIASSPGLNALEHARYDVWVIRCKT